jgi:hypothetical protein
MWGNNRRLRFITEKDAEMKTIFCKTPYFLALIAATLAFAGCDSTVTSDTDKAVTETANNVTILQMLGFVSIERGDNLYEGREGVRLLDLDIVRTGEAASAWLSLDDDRALQLGEQTALRIDRQNAGFELTLLAGEIVAYTDQLQGADEDVTFASANMSMGVRGQTELFDGLLTLNSELPPSMVGFSGWEEYTWENYYYVGEWQDGAPAGEGMVVITQEDGEVTLTGELVNGFFHGLTTRSIALNNGIILDDELELNMGRLANTSRQVYGMQPWISGETP